MAELARKFECVRVTDMRHVDLDRHRFDCDLTFAVLLMNADGTIYHRYGGRDWKDAESALSIPSLVTVMRGTLEEHAARSADAANASSSTADPPPRVAAASPLTSPPRTIEQSESCARRDAQKRVDCVHCHSVSDFTYKDEVARGTWRREKTWRFPEPARIGLTLDRDDAQKITAVSAGSPSAAAEVRVGDRLLRAGSQRILSRADLQWALEEAPSDATPLALEIERDGAPRKATLALPAGWKACDALEYSWRPFQWNLSPHPGFGGKALEEDEKRRLGLAPGKWAMRVGYLVTFGEHPETGRNAQAAGLKKDDVLLSVAGKDDFASERHFQTWFRFALEPGKSVDLVVLRDGKRRTLKLPVLGS